MRARQTVIEGIPHPPAPEATPELVRAAVLAFIDSNAIDWGDKEQAAQDISNEWHSHMDGYELAKKLETYHSWEITAVDVEDLDCIGSVVHRSVEEARKEWAAQWNIQPLHTAGTRVKIKNGRCRGVIAGLYEYWAATYMVKEDGCTIEGRHILVKFEDAEAEQ